MAKVVVIASFAPSLISFRGPLLSALVARGHHVTALAPDFDEATMSALEEIGVQYERMSMQRTGLNPLSDVRDFIRLVAALRALKPDILLSYTIKPVIYGSLAARFSGVQNIYSIVTGIGFMFMTNTSKYLLIRPILMLLYRASLSFNRVVFFQNPDDLDFFRSLGLLRETHAVLINGSGVDLEYFSEVEPRSSPVVFLLIARLLTSKGISEYFEAARTLKARHPTVSFRLIGPPDPSPDGISIGMIEDSAADGSVSYLGGVCDVRPFLADTSVYVLPSYREGTPRSVLEAMATGRAIVTTDVPGCRETVVDQVNGFLVPVRDSGALAACMERFILKPELILSMGKESRRMAEEKYDVHMVNEVILNAMGLDNQM